MAQFHKSTAPPLLRGSDDGRRTDQISRSTNFEKLACPSSEPFNRGAIISRHYFLPLFPERAGKVRGKEGQKRGEIRGKVEIREGASHGQTTTTSPPRDVTTIHQNITKTMASNALLGLKSLHLISMMSPDEPQK